MGKRILNWFIFGIFFALMPLIIYMILHYLSNMPLQLKECIPELLFFTIMVCATCLWDVNDMKKKIKSDIVFNLFFASLIILLIFSAILYGGIQLQNMQNNIEFMSLQKVYTFSMFMTIASGILGTIIQIVLSRIEVQSYE